MADSGRSPGIVAGEPMSALMRAHDWAATSLGPTETWPQSLRTALRLALTTHQPACVLWGAELIGFHNEAFGALIGPDHHPAALGRPAREVWGKIWEVIGPQLDFVMSGGGAIREEARLLPITRSGCHEDVWWTYSYSPIDCAEAPGGIGGVFVLCNDVTEQHRAREALRESEARFRAVFDSGLLGLGIFDAPTQRTLAINDEALRLMDCTREEFEAGSRDWRAATAPEHRSRDEVAIEQLLATGRADPFEKDFVRKDGRRVPVRLSLAPLPGQPGRVVVGAEDLTARRAAEHALRESEDRFRTLANVVPNFIWFAAPGGEVLYLNDRWYEYTGQTPQAALPDGWIATVHPDDAARTSAAWAEARARNTTYEIELRYRRHDGAYRWYIARAEPLRDGAGRHLAWFGSGTDIHDRKLAEAALAESEARLRLAQEAAGAGSWQFDFTSGLCRLSPESVRMLGLPEGHAGVMTTEEWNALIHPDDVPLVRDAMRGAVFGHHLHDCTFRVPLADGSVRWIQGLGRAEYAPGGKPVGIYGLNLDVTERRRAEERQALLMRELDHRAKNTLAVVQATLRLTPKGDAQAYARAVEGRIRALARAHAMLAEARWERGELTALLQAELAPFLTGQRAELIGPRVALPAASAQAIAMAVHELATNAVKHGALSQPNGRVFVSWQLERDKAAGPLLRLTWAESGGPPLLAPPQLRGFGTRMLESTVEFQLGGTLSMDWRSEGLACEMTLPLDSVPPDAAWLPRAAPE